MLLDVLHVAIDRSHAMLCYAMPDVQHQQNQIFGTSMLAVMKQLETLKSDLFYANIKIKGNPSTLLPVFEINSCNGRNTLGLQRCRREQVTCTPRSRSQGVITSIWAATSEAWSVMGLMRRYCGPARQWLVIFEKRQITIIKEPNGTPDENLSFRVV
ncbi:hypothetical protein BGZ60DRAFT_22299 [Tricladium varicosporioides]|nr:hypothetical protein BGZ60DRAFT_22299 [Hymenoscyphus varicosporioides]